MIKFIKAYFSDVWHLMTRRQSVPLRVGTGRLAYLVCIVPGILYPLFDAMVAARGLSHLSWGTAVAMSVLSALAVVGWFGHRGVFMVPALIYLWSGLLTWAVFLTGVPMWIVLIVSVTSLLVPLFYNKAELNQKEPG